jgi:hypothetical protein
MDFCAVSRRDPRDAGYIPSHRPGGSARIETVPFVNAAYEYSKLVFPLNTGVMQFPDPLPIASRVWLDTPDYIHHFCPGTVYSSTEKGFEIIRGSGNTLGNREFTGLGNRSTASLDQITNELIERRAKIMEYLAHDDAEAKRNRFINDMPIDPLSGLNIFLSSDVLMVGCEECFDLRIKVVTLLFGPFDLFF